jgi:glycosyltransferase involved in cell wall biosynthesis
MKLSIIIPVYNVEKFLPTCLESLLAQDIDINDYEILIINDGSKDNSLTVANVYRDKYSHIKVYTKENNGVGSARNKGIEIAKGKYIYFIDPDDYLISNTLNELINSIELNNLDILTFSSIQVLKSQLNEDRKIRNAKISKIQDGKDYITSYKYKNEVWWYFIKRDFLLNSHIKFIEDRWMEDAIFTAKLFLEANAMANLPLDAHRHFLVKGSAMRNKEPKHYLKVIDDKRNAAIVFETIIEDLKKKNINAKCVKRLTVRQQSFVFFMMVRMLKSTISLKQIRLIIDDLSKTGAYPLKNFLGQDYNGISYNLLLLVFNRKHLYFLTFKFLNPILKLKFSLK